MPRATQDTAIDNSLCLYGTITLIVTLSNVFQFIEHQMSRSYNPHIAETTWVWANPISLATTLGITIVFSSSGYLDVSVHRVCFHLHG